MKGMISDFKRMSVHDGPGIRTTLFLKGCPLRCLWCHNPENLTMPPAISFTQKLCIGCGMCIPVCAQGVHTLQNGVRHLQYEVCTGCGKCAEECLTGALKIYGQEMADEEAAQRLLEDRRFYESSGGGVTFSGGEPLLQPQFLASIMCLLKEAGVHIAVDTCGEVPWANFEAVMPHTDLFLYDVKHLDSEAHRRGTGVGNERILDNLRKLVKAGAKVEIRTPVIPGYNDDPVHLKAIASLLAELEHISAWRLLPYHSMAKGKYEALGMKNPMPETEMPDTVRMREIQEGLKAIFPRVMLPSD